MRNVILAALISPVLLAILPAATRADLLITLSDPNTQATVMTIEMASIDASSITSASVLATLLATPGDYSTITTFFPTGTSPLVVTGTFTQALGLPVTTFSGSTFTSDLSSGVPPGQSSVYAALTTQFADNAFQVFTQLPSNILLSTTTAAGITNGLTVSGTVLDGTFADVTAVPEASTMVIAGMTLATYLAWTSVRRLVRRRPTPTPGA
jgi:hypothetical protein